jgi:hypothetical protein
VYNAFISYSHSADDKFAPSLQDALQKFAKPWYKKRNLEIFRDESSLSASPHLWDNITQALDQSAYLVLLASQESEQSKWVNREVEYWLAHKSIDNILIALTDGHMEWDDKTNGFLDAAHNSLPPVLDGKFDSPPFYIDLRHSKTQEDLSLANPIFKKEVLKLAAKLHGVHPNDLASTEVTVHRKMIFVRNAVAGALAVLLVASVYAAFIATKESRNAIEQQALAVHQRDTARGNFVISEAKSMLTKDPTLALRMTEAAMTYYKGDAINRAADEIYENNFFYKTLLSPDSSKPSRIFTKFIFSRNGEYVLSGLANNAMILWHRNGDKLDSVQYFVGHTARLRRADFSADGKWVVTGSDDKTARIWDIATGTLVRTISAGGPVTNVEFQPHGEFLATRFEGSAESADGSQVTLWYAQTGARFFDIPISGAIGMVFSPDGKTLLTHHSNEGSYLWNISNRPASVKKASRLTSNWDDGEPITAAFSQDGTKVAIGYYQQVVRIYNLKGESLSTQVQNKGISKIIFPPSDSGDPYSGNLENGLSGSFITGTYDGIVTLWNYHGDDRKNIKTRLEWGLKSLIDEKHWVTDIVQLNTMDIMAAYSDGHVRLWDIQKNSDSSWQGYVAGNRLDTLPASIRKVIFNE